MLGLRITPLTPLSFSSVAESCQQWTIGRGKCNKLLRYAVDLKTSVTITFLKLRREKKVLARYCYQKLLNCYTTESIFLAFTICPLSVILYVPFHVDRMPVQRQTLGR
jgi:hypothetical protein